MTASSVIVVEDTEEIRELVATVLGRAGMACAPSARVGSAWRRSAVPPPT